MPNINTPSIGPSLRFQEFLHCKVDFYKIPSRRWDNRCIPSKCIWWIVYSFQVQKFLNPPCSLAINSWQFLITGSIVDIGKERRVRSSIIQCLTNAIAKLLCHCVKWGVWCISNYRWSIRSCQLNSKSPKLWMARRNSREGIILSNRHGCCRKSNSIDGFGSKTFEEHQGPVEGWVLGGSVIEEIVDRCCTNSIVSLDVLWESESVEFAVLTNDIVDAVSGESSQLWICRGTIRDGNRVEL